GRPYDRRDCVAGAPRHIGAGVSRVVYRGRQTVHRGDNGAWRAGKSAPGPAHARARTQIPAERQRNLRVHAAGPALIERRRTSRNAVLYQRNAVAQVGLAMNVQRFADAGVLAAVADRAVATTLITAEGRALTEMVPQVRNRAQPFLKVTLPPGAAIVSVEVAGEGAKPVVGSDGTRVPLLRPGFRPSGVYSVSYVYLHAAAPFAKKGELAMSLPKMDIPVGILEWETFVPDRYGVQIVGGNVID